MAVNLNGDMSQWTWGTEFLSCAHAQIVTDCFRYLNTTGAAHHVRRSTDVPDIMDCGRVIPYSLEVEVATAEASVPAAGNLGIVYRGEGSEWAHVHKRPTTLRCWVKTDVAGVYHFGLANGPENLYCANAVEIGVMGVWTPVEVTMPPAPGEWYTDHRIGYSMFFFLASGSNLHDRAGIWADGAECGGSNQVNFNAVAGKKIRLTGFRLRHADDERPDEFEMPEATELACMRYTESTFPRNEKPRQNFGMVKGEELFTAQRAGTLLQAVSPRFRVPKRKAPTMVAFNPVGNNAFMRDYTAGQDSGAVSFDNVTEYGFRAYAAGHASTAIGNTIGVHWLADANLPAPNGGSGA